MKKILYISFITAFTFACNKEKFPNPKQLQGTWTTISGNSLNIN